MFISMLKKLSINVPLIEPLNKMHGYAKFMKEMMTKKRAVTFEDGEKKEDPGAFIIPSTNRVVTLLRHLCDLCASINLMPL